MRSDPEPNHAIVNLDGESTIAARHPSGPKSTNLLEVKRGVTSIHLEFGKRLIGGTANLTRQGTVKVPETWRSMVNQSSEVLPAT